MKHALTRATLFIVLIGMIAFAWYKDTQVKKNRIMQKTQVQIKR